MEMQMEALTTKRNNPEMITLWTQRIAECKNSGISSQEWCEQNGIESLSGKKEDSKEETE